MTIFWIIIANILLADLFFVWCCCQVASWYDDAEASDLDECANQEGNP